MASRAEESADTAANAPSAAPSAVVRLRDKSLLCRSNTRPELRPRQQHRLLRPALKSGGIAECRDARPCVRALHQVHTSNRYRTHEPCVPTYTNTYFSGNKISGKGHGHLRHEQHNRALSQLVPGAALHPYVLSRAIWRGHFCLLRGGLVLIALTYGMEQASSGLPTTTVGATRCRSTPPCSFLWPHQELSS